MLKHLILKLSAILVAACIWLPCLQLFFKPDLEDYRCSEGVSPVAAKLAQRHLRIWTDLGLREVELQKMQDRNPEWDFMSRTYFVMALANMALRDETYKLQACEIMDAIIDNTLAIERENGHRHFLLAYGHSGSWKLNPPRSLFVDGEIALMMACRRFVEEKEQYRTPLDERVALMVNRMKKSDVLCAESYPDECWLFCNTIALAAIRMADVLNGSAHSEFLSEWMATAKRKLVEPKTGILISAYGMDGTPAPCGFGPEGSTIWMACHLLEIIDEDYAWDQYKRSKKELSGSVLGFGYSREWPSSSPGTMDIDSGPVVPLVGASASASGLAIVAAAAFDDDSYLASLLNSLNAAGFPSEKDDSLQYMASNPVGDAVLLYALVEGPLWEKVKSGRK